MNTTATPHTRTPRFSRRFLSALLVLFVGLPLVLAACEIIEVMQPSSAEQGEVIEVTLTIEQPIEDTNPHRGVVSVLVPEDWAFVSGEYSGDAGPGDMLEDEGWSDSTEIVLPAPAGMKWIGTISDEAYAVTNPPGFYDVTFQLQVGATTGDFDIGYFTTNDAFGTADIAFGPSEENTADTLMNVPIMVNPAVANEEEVQPDAFALAQNFPNPFRTATAITYTLDRAAAVRVTVFDAAGREVSVLEEGTRAAGDYTVDFDARDLAGGTYLYRLEVDGEVVASRTMTLAK
jgi:hypothetical protein